jgi:hypothetical protein
MPADFSQMTISRVEGENNFTIKGLSEDEFAQRETGSHLGWLYNEWKNGLKDIRPYLDHPDSPFGVVRVEGSAFSLRLPTKLLKELGEFGADLRSNDPRSPVNGIRWMIQTAVHSNEIMYFEMLATNSDNVRTNIVLLIAPVGTPDARECILGSRCQRLPRETVN